MSPCCGGCVTGQLSGSVRGVGENNFNNRFNIHLDFAYHEKLQWNHLKLHKIQDSNTKIESMFERIDKMMIQTVITQWIFPSLHICIWYSAI